jgi:hypothetical protein
MLLFRTVSTCVKHKVPIDHAARQVTARDFTTFTHILASDENNLQNLRQMTPKNSTAEVRLFGSYNDGKAIPDPYYGGIVSLHAISPLGATADLDDFILRTALNKSISNVFAIPTPSWTKSSGKKSQSCSLTIPCPTCSFICWYANLISYMVPLPLQ